MEMSKSLSQSALSKLVEREVYSRLSPDSQATFDEESVHFEQQLASNDWWWTEVHERQQKEKKLANRIRAIKSVVGRTARNLFVKHEPWDPATRPLPNIPKGELPKELAVGRLYLDLCSTNESPKRKCPSYRNDIKRALWRLTNSRPMTNVQFPVSESGEERVDDDGEHAQDSVLSTSNLHINSPALEESTGGSTSTRPMSAKKTLDFPERKLKRILEAIERWERDAYKDLTGHGTIQDQEKRCDLAENDHDERLSYCSTDEDVDRDYDQGKYLGNTKRESTSLVLNSAKSSSETNLHINNPQPAIRDTENYNTCSIDSVEPLLRSDATSRNIPYVPVSELEQESRLLDNNVSPSLPEKVSAENSYITHWDMETRGFEPVDAFEQSLAERGEQFDSYISHQDMEQRNSHFGSDYSDKKQFDCNGYITHEELEIRSSEPQTQTTNSSTDKTLNPPDFEFDKLHSDYIAWKRLNKLKNRHINKNLKQQDSSKRLPQAWRWLAFIERKFNIDFEDSDEDESSDQPDLSLEKENQGCLGRRYSFGDRHRNDMNILDADIPHSDVEGSRKKALANKMQKRKNGTSSETINGRRLSHSSSDQLSSTMRLTYSYNQMQSRATESSHRTSEQRINAEDWIGLNDWIEKEQPKWPTKPIPRYEAFNGDHDFCLLYDLLDIKRRFGHPLYKDSCPEEIKSLISRAINAIYLRCLCKMRDRLKQKQEAKMLMNENKHETKKKIDIKKCYNAERQKAPEDIIIPRTESHFPLITHENFQMNVQVISYSPYSDQIPGEEGLIKHVSIFKQPYYLELYIQSILNANDLPKSLVLGGEPRYFARKALLSIARICVANQVERLIVPYDCVMTTATASHLIRSYKADGGIVLTGCSLPAGQNGFFGIRYYDRSGAVSTHQILEKIAKETSTIRRFKIYRSNLISRGTFKTSCAVGRTIFDVVDASKSHLDLLKRCIPLDMIYHRLFKSFHESHSLYRPEWRILVDCRHGAAGPLVNSVFKECLQIPQEYILNVKPLGDLGGCDAVPDSVTAASFVKRVKQQSDIKFGIAFSANGERCLIVTKTGPLAMCDVASAVTKIIPLLVQQDLKSHLALGGSWTQTNGCGSHNFARTYASSSILDRIAKRYGIPCQLVPTSSHFWYLMEAGKADICCDENYGLAFNHLREFDAMFVALAMLYLVARSLKNLNESLEWVWQDFGREYVLRHEFKDVELSGCMLWMKHMDAQLISKAAMNQYFGDRQRYKCTDCGRFDYRDSTTDSWTQYRYPMQVTFNHKSRVYFGITRTSLNTATVCIRVYEWSEEYNHDTVTFLTGLMNAAYDLGKVALYLGKSKPIAIACN